MEHQDEPYLGNEPTRNEAEEFVRSLVRWIGPGFHPDSDFNDYVVSESGAPLFPPAQASRLNEKLDRTISVLGDGGEDVYDIAAPVQYALLAPYFSEASVCRFTDT